MYVRDAKNREEVWLLDRLDELGLDDPAFRSRDYVVALDESSGRKAGFGRILVHAGADDEEVCEVTAVGVLEGWRDQGVGAHVVERLVETARSQGFETLYALTGAGGYCTQFGFRAVSAADLPAVLRERLAEVRERTDPDAVPLRLDVADFRMPRRLRERFKGAGDAESECREEGERPEDFGIDPEKATYKYDTGRR